MGVFSSWKIQSLWNYFLPFLLMIHSTVGNSRSPLIVLDQYEGSGIRLICTSETLPPELQLLWVDGKGQELAAPATTTPGNTNIASSFLLQPGSGNAVTCRIVSKVTKISAGSTSVIIADIFFPSTSRWMVAFFMIAVLGMIVIIAIFCKLNKNRWKLALSDNERKATEEEIGRLNIILEKEKVVSQEALKEVQARYENTMAELEFRSAVSHAVNITLDPHCTHPKLIIQGKNRVKLNSSDSGQKDLKGTLIAVANEGFSSGKLYWEVEVGGRPFWELGVLAETVRKRLINERLEKPLEEGYVSIQWFQCQYHCTGGNSLTDSQNKECAVVGVFLDFEENMLSFYDVELMCLIRSIPVEFFEKMYPFFNPGSDEKYLGVWHMNSPPCLASL
ncbi:butyrophilin subfamily 2 member A2-like [Eublepharis macularius]|uniref:Butyrophilin subfamily 2 member A2-like n=1 Tax=Eublepharis macularius TaxID=481883 RepID=A0AA97LB37_EUBMA|nr:butyrophilin subfamily 2 member A2-like [Eublepharis macularius]